jgi:hypothetical protein
MAFKNATSGDHVGPTPVVDHPRDHVGGPKPLEPTINGKEKFQRQDFAAVSALEAHPKVSHGNHNPVRSKGKTTAAVNIESPVPLT